jgi:hypothetical protein
MCTGVETAMLVASLAGAGASTYSQAEALRKQDQAAAEGIRQQGEINRQASQRVNQEIQKISSSNPDAEREAARRDFTAALQRSTQQPGAVAYGSPGAVSSRFAEDVGTASAGTAAEGANLADLTSRIDAPMYQRVREGQSAASALSDLGLLGGQSAGQDFLTQLKLRGIAPNPWISGLGQAASAFANAYSQRAPSGVATPGTVPIGGHSGNIPQPSKLPSWAG